MRIKYHIFSLLALFLVCSLQLSLSLQLSAADSSDFTETALDSIWSSDGDIPSGDLDDIRAEDVIQWEQGTSALIHSGERVSVGLRLTTKKGFSIYKKNLSFSGPEGFSLTRVIAPTSTSLPDPLTGGLADVYQGGDFSLLFQKILPGDLPESFPVHVTFVGCTHHICLTPYTKTIDLRVYSAVSALPDIFDRQTEASATEDTSADIASAMDSGQSPSLENRLASQLQNKKLNFFLLLLLMLIGGILTNLTPCVYPMIPITVRILAVQSHRPWTASLAYAAGVMLSYCALGLFASLSGSMFGQLMSSAYVSAAFAVMMLFFAVSMLGFGDFSFFQKLGDRFASRSSGIKKAFFMGTGAGLVASPCTGPILAALMTYVSGTDDLIRSSLLMLTYSAGFSLPYLFLGGAAAKVSAVRVPPNIQLIVKMSFSALMFALSFYYMRVPAYSLFRTLQGEWPTLTIIGLCAGPLTGLLLLQNSSLWHMRRLLLIPSLISGLGLFSGSQWLNERAGKAGRAQLVWLHDEAEAIRTARQSKIPLLIDFWAEWCEACKKMDADTFSDSRVIAHLKENNWLLLKLDLTESNEKNDDIQKRYEIHGLPTLTIIPSESQSDKSSWTTLTGYTSPDTLMQALRPDNFKRE